MKALSRLLDMPERTLRYRLQCEGSSYRELRDEVLQQQAGVLLATKHLPVGQIAERLGYAEPAAFIRAFQRMSGLTPGQFRLTLPIKSDLNGKNR